MRYGCVIDIATSGYSRWSKTALQIRLLCRAPAYFSDDLAVGVISPPA
jgi:hypothetical protein